MGESLNKRRAAALLQQAEAKLGREPAEAERLAAQVVSGARSPEAYALLAEARSQLGNLDAAMATAEEGLAAFPNDPTLSAWKGGSLVRRRLGAEALPFLERARTKHGKDSTVLLHYAWALHLTGQSEKAETAARKAVELGGGAPAKVELAKLLGLAGRHDAAETILSAVERGKAAPQVIAEARALRGDALLFLGDAAGAVASWRALDRDGGLQNAYVGHYAYAAQLSGETALADELIARRGDDAGPEDYLLFGLIALLRGDPEATLGRLDAARKAKGVTAPEFEYELLGAEGRALRLLGRREEALKRLRAAAQLPAYGTRRLGPRVRVDLSHLAAEEGDFETSARLLTEALQLDPGDPEAVRAMELTRKRVAWRTEVDANAEARVEAAQAEADAMRRRFSSRESELEAEVRKARAAREEAERRAKEAVELARQAQERAAEAEKERVRSELAARDVSQRTEGSVARAFSGIEKWVPPDLRQGVSVAESTYQQAIEADQPATAAAFMFSSVVLERALRSIYAVRFDEWLKKTGRLRAFLDGSVKSRGRRTEYFDRFVDAFDVELKAKPPGLGEISRVLERRTESYLAPFRDYLGETFDAPDAFYGELAEFVKWVNEEIRTPIAHGTIDEFDHAVLKKLREQLLFSFRAYGKGALALMLTPKAK